MTYHLSPITLDKRERPPSNSQWGKGEGGKKEHIGGLLHLGEDIKDLDKSLDGLTHGIDHEYAVY